MCTKIKEELLISRVDKNENDYRIPGNGGFKDAERKICR